ncbi:aldo/keto reductase [Acidisoma cellulosilytica]|uniref:Aldo/keto reductase n=1 Tax=Acidisoma cellulosilyticum TaxID=2802395 RepID=A0A963Z376_9PROT|nr:aldo/keto reductase [Acidisoma cellulosilyticum]MCB8881998.1 aldo/keto reductase [Acidisoma cellulosilyticum]
MRTVDLPNGRSLPVMGLGTWRMGEARSDKAAEIRVIQKAMDLGISLLDTAEIYGNGGSERVVGEAILGRRDSAFIVSKVAPSHATRKGTISACEGSLTHLGIETLDLYLLHWRGGVPVSETIDAFETLKAQGKIRAWGVSNFDVDDLEDIPDLTECSANQVLYNPQSRGIEYSLLPLCQSHQIPIMAYTPFGQSGAVLKNAAIAGVAHRHNATPGQVILAWGIRHPGVVTIPKTATLARVEENLGALSLQLTAEDLAEIDRAFPPPRRKSSLEML